MEAKPSTIVRNYFGTADTAPEAFADSANAMQAEGYFPISTSWAAGEPNKYGASEGTLIVIYEYRPNN
jgi:hypothetical protein